MRFFLRALESDLLLPVLDFGGRLHPLAHGCFLIPPNPCFCPHVSSCLSSEGRGDVSDAQDRLWAVSLLRAHRLVLGLF